MRAVAVCCTAALLLPACDLNPWGEDPSYSPASAPAGIADPTGHAPSVSVDSAKGGSGLDDSASGAGGSDVVITDVAGDTTSGGPSELVPGAPAEDLDEATRPPTPEPAFAADAGAPPPLDAGNAEASAADSGPASGVREQ